jgi:hypothetical protein
MRYARWLTLCGVLLAACSSDSNDKPQPAASSTPDGGSKTRPTVDAAAADSGKAGSVLERPGLPRPPKTGLPAELRPPRAG